MRAAALAAYPPHKTNKTASNFSAKLYCIKHPKSLCPTFGVQFRLKDAFFSFVHIGRNYREILEEEVIITETLLLQGENIVPLTVRHRALINPLIT